MKTTSILILALALCLCFVLPVSAVGTYYESKYVERNAFDTQQPIDKVTGTLKGSVRSGFNLFTNEIGVRNDANPDGVKGTFEFYPINPDGTFEIVLIPGSFALMVKDGNGGQPEYSHATIIANTVSNPEREILGHAVSTGDDVCKPVYNIEKATYGASELRCHMDTVTDVEAYNEYRTVDHEHYYIYDRKDFGHWEGQGWNKHWHSEWKVKCTNHAEHGEGWHNETSDCKDAYTVYGQWTRTKPHHCEYETRTIPAQTREVEVCVEYGQVIDVTSNVQNAVAQGYTSFLFSNGHGNYYGGIWDITNTQILSEIEDPAKNIVKNVFIEYSNGCGSERTIKAMEYCTIDLATGSAICPSQQTT